METETETTTEGGGGYGGEDALSGMDPEMARNPQPVFKLMREEPVMSIDLGGSPGHLLTRKKEFARAAAAHLQHLGQLHRLRNLPQSDARHNPGFGLHFIAKPAARECFLRY